MAALIDTLNTPTIVKPKGTLKLRNCKLNVIKNEVIINDARKLTTKCNEDEIKQYLEILAPQRANDNKEWVKVGLALFNCGSHFDLWDEFSMQSNNYNKNEVIKQWNSFKNDDEVNFGSIIHWAKLDNPEKFKEIKNNQKYTMSNKLFEHFQCELRLANNAFASNILNEILTQHWLIFDKTTMTYFYCDNDEIDPKSVNSHRWIKATGDLMIKNYAISYLKHFTYLYGVCEIRNKFASMKCNINVNIKKLAEIHEEITLPLSYDDIIKTSNHYQQLLTKFITTLDTLKKEAAANIKAEDKRLKGELKRNVITLDEKSKIMEELDDANKKIIELHNETMNVCGEIKAIFKSCDAFLKMIDDRFIAHALELSRDHFLFRCEGETLFNLLDSKPYLVGFKNGVFDLLNNEFRETQPTDFISMHVGYDYVAERNTKIEDEINTFWEKILPNKELRDYWTLIKATCLSAGNPHELFIILTGTGSNGKSKDLELLDKTLGAYADTIENAVFIAGKSKNAQGPTPSLAKASKKRFVKMSEPEKREPLNWGKIKEYTGGDKIEVRGLYNDPIVFKPQFKLLLQCNDIPRVSNLGSSDGEERRTVIIPFEQKFYKDAKDGQNKADTTLSSKFDGWRMSCFHLLNNKFQEYIKNGKKLNTPEIVKDKVKRFFANDNPLKLWVKENVIKVDNLKKEEEDIKVDNLKKEEEDIKVDNLKKEEEVIKVDNPKKEGVIAFLTLKEIETAFLENNFIEYDDGDKNKEVDWDARNAFQSKYKQGELKDILNNNYEVKDRQKINQIDYTNVVLNVKFSNEDLTTKTINDRPKKSPTPPS